MKRAIIKFIFIIFGTVVYISCSPSITFKNTPDDRIGWNMFGGDPYHSNSINTDLIPPLQLIKKIKTSSVIGISPIVSDGVIYTACLDGNL